MHEQPPMLDLIGIRQTYPLVSAREHGINYLGSIGFKVDSSSNRLGLAKIIEVNEMPLLTSTKVKRIYRKSYCH